MSFSEILETASKIFLLGANDALPWWCNLFKEVRDKASFTNLSQDAGIFESGNDPDISNS